LPEATLQPGQTRHLPTNVVNLGGPTAGASTVSLPAKNEVLRIGAVGEASPNPRVAKALKRLAAEKAPPTVAQLVMWKLTANRPWDELAALSGAWANGREVALARAFIRRLDAPGAGEPAPDADPASFYWAVVGDDTLGAVLKDRTVVGLKAREGIPPAPDGPSLACEARATGSGASAALEVRLAAPDADGRRWGSLGRVSVSPVGPHQAPPAPHAGAPPPGRRGVEQGRPGPAAKGPAGQRQGHLPDHRPQRLPAGAERPGPGRHRARRGEGHDHALAPLGPLRAPGQDHDRPGDVRGSRSAP